jgi:predicted site-specific integrase-resolvase
MMKWLSLPEACAYARRSRNTLLRHIREGKIIASKPDGRWIVDRESIDSFYQPEISKKALEIVRSLRQ